MAQKYPHLLPNEVKIWEVFLRKHGNEYLSFEYDVHVGKVPPEILNQPPKWRKAAESVYRKRIDVIGFQSDRVTVFEVKPHAGLGAVGQIAGYLTLYDDEFNPKRELLGAIVTDYTDINTIRVCEEHGIELVEVGKGVLL